MAATESNLVVVRAEADAVSTTDYISRARAFINDSLDRDVAEHVDPSFREIFDYTLLDHDSSSRGRPILALIAGEALGLSWKFTSDLALGVEKFHNYSLIEDDMPGQDGSETRRGKLSAWKKFDPGPASLAGTFMLGDAYRSIDAARRENSLSGSLIAEHVQPLIRRLLVGQQQDLGTFQGAGKAHVTVEQLDRISLGKTAPLLEMGIVGAAILARAEDPILKSLRTYAQQAGLVLQINNDLEDLSQRGDDARNGKPTYVSLMGGVEPVKRKLRDHAEQAWAVVEPLTPEIDVLHLVEVVKQIGRQVYLAAEVAPAT